ncbi:MAG: hypothetical protein KAR43_06385 [Deltaproteobacteria bacterium]|nr:hypothetical protein [Deltaproteobacteria bacterium]
MPHTMLEKITKNLQERMSGYNHSMQPTDDEVRLAWLVSEVEELNRRLESKPIKNVVSINSYPSNYVEEEMPQIIVEVRYLKDYNPDNPFRKEEAISLAAKTETFINEIL